MSLNIDLYERTVVFVQRIKPDPVINETFFKYADLNYIVKNKLFKNIDYDDVEFSDDSMPARTIIFPKKNIRITGSLDRLILSMDDASASDKFFYDASKKYSEALVKENISAIGINFNGIIETKDADGIIKGKILDKCPDFLNNADTASFKLVYKDSDGKAFFVTSIDIGSIKSSKTSSRKGILVSCNYHREIKSQQLMKAKMNEFQDSLEKVKVRFEEHKKQMEGFLNG